MITFPMDYEIGLVVTLFSPLVITVNRLLPPALSQLGYGGIHG